MFSYCIFLLIFQLSSGRIGKFAVMSLEIRPLAALYPPNPQRPPKYKNVLYRAAISVVVGGVMLIPTAFAPFSIVSVKKIYMGGLISTWFLDLVKNYHLCSVCAHNAYCI